MKNKRKVYFQLLNAFVSPYYLIGVAAASVFFIIDVKDAKGLASLLFFPILFSFFIKVAVIIHELGHLVFGKLVGGKPHHAVIGLGHEIVKG